METQPPAQLKLATILLVDDEEELREILKEEFEYYGYAVIEAANGRQAFELIKQNQMTLDAVLTDIRMPGGSGTELLDSVVKSGISIPVFFLTAFVDLSEGDAKSRGACGVFAKPCDFLQIITAVCKELAVRGISMPRQLKGRL